MLDAVSELIVVLKDGMTRRLPVRGLRRTADAYLVRLEGVNDRDAASALTLGQVRVRRTELPPLAPGEFFVEDVAGCGVFEVDTGRALGLVRGTFWNGAHDVATVVADDGAERLIPLVPDFVVGVDLAGRKMVVRWDDDDDHER